MGLLFTKIWSFFGNEGKIKFSLTPVKLSVINQAIIEFCSMKLSVSECILKSVMHSLAETVRHLPYFPAHKTHLFFPKKCHLNSACILCTEGKYYFQTYKYPYCIEWKQPWRWF